MIDMRSRRCARGEDFSGVNQRARMRWRQAYGEQRGVATRPSAPSISCAMNPTAKKSHQLSTEIGLGRTGGNSNSFRSKFVVTARRQNHANSGMSALGQKRTYAVQIECPLRANSGHCAALISGSHDHSGRPASISNFRRRSASSG